MLRKKKQGKAYVSLYILVIHLLWIELHNRVVALVMDSYVPVLKIEKENIVYDYSFTIF